MDAKTTYDEQFLAIHFYRYLMAIAIGGLIMILMVFERSLLSQFRSWISPETLNSRFLTWFGLSVFTGVIAFMMAIIFEFLQGRSWLHNMIWYLIIILGTLFFGTLFDDVMRGAALTGLTARLLILIGAGVYTLVSCAVFYSITFERWHNFGVFAAGIIAATTAYNWLYLNILPRIAVY